MSTQGILTFREAVLTADQTQVAKYLTEDQASADEQYGALETMTSFHSLRFKLAPTPMEESKNKFAPIAKILLSHPNRNIHHGWLQYFFGNTVRTNFSYATELFFEYAPEALYTSPGEEELLTLEKFLSKKGIYTDCVRKYFIQAGQYGHVESLKVILRNAREHITQEDKDQVSRVSKIQQAIQECDNEVLSAPAPFLISDPLATKPLTSLISTTVAEPEYRKRRAP